RRRERLLDRDAGELAGPPEAPPVGERDPVDEDLSGDALLEHRLVDVAGGEPVLDDLADARVVVADRGLLPAYPPAGHDRSAHLARDVEEDPVLDDGAAAGAREEEVHHLARRPHAARLGAAMLFHRETEPGHRARA